MACQAVDAKDKRRIAMYKLCNNHAQAYLVHAIIGWQLFNNGKCLLQPIGLAGYYYMNN